ncbi:MAG TPA: non-ribosomal peptide synthetase, partial [Puia sp.]|uniref:non-ribosomal peptide synthetase n=1 Tax=Puia sp. TaxID=2045100 RepID=UPI002C9E015C
KPIDASRVPIGKPLPNFRLYVLNSQGQLCPQGVPGQICVAGTGIGPGYLADPQKTALHFTTDPFQQGSVRLYRTGDRGRWTDHGLLEFLGRIDEQVKIRGHRIELPEIEEALMTLTGISAAAVRYFEDTGTLAAYYTTDNPQITPDALRRHLDSRLPQYMIPTDYIELKQLPLSPNGKTDKQKLPRPELRRNHIDPPETPLQENLCRIWTELLSLEKVGINDNFFDLGGHSLRAVNLIGRIEAQLHIRLELKDIFLYPTISGLSRLIDTLDWFDASRHLQPAEDEADTIII